MANQEHVAAKENVRGRTFEWRIERFKVRKAEKRSSKFKIGRSDFCYLFIDGNNEKCAHCRGQNCIYLISSSREAFDDKKYKLRLIARSGQEIFLAKRIPIGKDSAYFVLAVIGDDELESKKDDLLPNGTLTLRLTWCEEEDCTQSERSTQTTQDSLDSEKEPAMLLETLSKHFGCYYESKMDTDCVLRVGDSQFPVHRQVLSARSEVFAAMFRHDTSENRSGLVDITDDNAAVLGDILYYVYSGQIRGLSADTAVPMYVATDKYALIELRDVCLDFLIRNITMENVCDAAVLAHTHTEIKLEERVVQYIQDELKNLWRQTIGNNF